MRIEKNNQFLLILAPAFLIIAIAGIFLLRGVKVNKERDIQTEKLEIQAASDETPSIEEDLRETNLSDIDKELQDIEAELQ